MQVFPRRQPGPPKQESEGRPFEIRLSATVLALVSVLIAATVGWSFVMGFIVGRGDDPGERLARFDPFVRTAEVNPAGSLSPAPAEGKVQENSKDSAEKEKDKSDVGPSRSDGKSEKPDLKQAVEQPHPFVRPRENAAGAWDSENVRLIPKDAEAEQNTGSERTAYFYQVASYKTKKQAEDLAKKLAGKRSRSYVQQNGSLYSVYLNIKANDAEYSELQALFAKLRISGPRLMARKGGNAPEKKETPRTMKKEQTGDKKEQKPAAADRKTRQQPEKAQSGTSKQPEGARKEKKDGQAKQSENAPRANRSGGGQTRSNEGSRKAADKSGPGKNAGETAKNQR